MLLETRGARFARLGWGALERAARFAATLCKDLPLEIGLAGLEHAACAGLLGEPLDVGTEGAQHALQRFELQLRRDVSCRLPAVR